MAVERRTLVLSLGPLDDLDDVFHRLEETKQHVVKPAQPWSGDVLLAGYGPKGSGDLYVFVGALFEPRLEDEVLHFSNVKRFWHPVVAIYSKAGIHRSGLIDDIQGWSPNHHFYAVTGVTAKVVAEAEASLRRRPAES